MPSVNLSPETYEKLEQLAADTGSTPEAAAELAVHHELRDRQLSPEEWRAEWDALLTSIRSRIPPELTQEEIQNDIDAAVRAARAKRRARSR